MRSSAVTTFTSFAASVVPPRPAVWLIAWVFVFGITAVPARAYQLWAELSALNAGGTNTTVGDQISAMRNLEPAHGGYIQRFSAVHGGRGELSMRSGRFSPNPALDTSTQQGRTAAATLRATLRVSDYQDLPGDTVTLIARFSLGSLHAFHGRSTEEGIIGPPTPSGLAYARLTARVSVGLGTSVSGNAWAQVRNDGRGNFTPTTSSGGFELDGPALAGPKMLEMRIKVPKTSLVAYSSQWNVVVSLVGEANAAGDNYYMEMSGSGSVWVGVQQGATWVSNPPSSPFLRAHPGAMILRVGQAIDDLEVSGFPGQVFQLRDTGVLGLGWNPAGQVTVGPDGTATVSLPRSSGDARFFSVIPAP